MLQLLFPPERNSLENYFFPRKEAAWKFLFFRHHWRKQHWLQRFHSGLAQRLNVYTNSLLRIQRPTFSEGLLYLNFLDVDFIIRSILKFLNSVLYSTMHNGTSNDIKEIEVWKKCPKVEPYCVPIFHPIMFKPFWDDAKLPRFCAKCFS